MEALLPTGQRFHPFSMLSTGLLSATLYRVCVNDTHLEAITDLNDHKVVDFITIAGLNFLSTPL